jgi:hypothetical protein
MGQPEIETALIWASNLFAYCDFSHFIIEAFESNFHCGGKGETIMHFQTSPTQIFTVFGSYPVDSQGDYFPSNSAESNSQGRHDASKMGSTDAFPEPANHSQSIIQ